jgi:GTP-binding protein
MFDRAEIVVKAGDGGDGAISFRHEKFAPFGGPDGGDGGDGGDMVIVADASVTSLRSFTRKRFHRADRGTHGKGQKKHGKRREDLILMVPIGTVVLDKAKITSEALIADLEQPAQRLIVAKGGKGGRGNTHFASSTNQVPRIAQKGEIGEERFLALELRLIADIGLIGYPNVGKSTLLTTVSAAKPKIASYPFTTLEPVLGVVEKELKTFVWAEIPGLIDGAHLGRGLGHDFLRHIMRTKILIHLVDGTSVSPAEDLVRVNTELSLFDPSLARKPQLVAINKIDLPEVQARLAEIERVLHEAGMSALFISAVTGRGIDELIAESVKVLDRVDTEASQERRLKAVFRPQPKGAETVVRKEGDIFIITAPVLERIVARVDVTDPEVRRQLRKQMVRLGVTRALEKVGVKPGEKVRCGGFEWEW